MGRGDPGWSLLQDSEGSVSLSRSSGGAQLRRTAESSEEILFFIPRSLFWPFFFTRDNMLELKLAVLLGEFHLFHSALAEFTSLNDCSSVRSEGFWGHVS